MRNSELQNSRKEIVGCRVGASRNCCEPPAEATRVWCGGLWGAVIVGQATASHVTSVIVPRPQNKMCLPPTHYTN